MAVITGRIVTVKGSGKGHLIVLVIFFLLLMSATVGGFLVNPWRPPVASEHGKGVDAMITYLLVTTGIIFIVGHIVLCFFVLRYSKEKTYKNLLVKSELLWSLPSVLIMIVIAEGGVLLIGLPVWQKLYGKLDADAIQVEVVGKQFEWLIRYPGKDGKFGKTDLKLVNLKRNPFGLVEEDPHAKDDIVSIGTLHLPVNKMASIKLRSYDVIHGFCIPNFRIKQDIVPGIFGQTQFKPDVVGEYELVCAELCGLGHHEMMGKVIVHDEKDFNAWLNKQTGWFE